ncbi:hypothetical protein RhiirA5_436773 [Rhizophagus irregularis]|uniref:Uncharacterized protein n=1 Tax=Rhizophagus irregularis TaxID=588596 RepID=A0A2N0NJR4_9GLOM|nr:hypothetical protein RhiirA5_438007 [Rhizophagus irregularis]PKB95408.1 hypothetical protein RhiirA5_436773 [Rhizophagus irregularis]
MELLADIVSGKGGKEVEVRDKKQERKVEESMSGINLSSPVTPPNRIYAELPSPGDVSEDSLKKRELKKDNVSPVEVVEIINQQREESKILYKRNDFSTTQNDSGSRLDEKIEKFEKIYKKVGNKMKWEVLGVQMKFVKH